MRIDKQLGIKDCGIYVLQAYAKHFYNKKCDINYLKLNAEYDANGISLSSFESLANKIGLNVNILEGDFDSLIKLNDVKNIATILNIEGFLHYVIILKKDDKSFTIIDSVRGKFKMSVKEFEESYNGFIITIEKSNIRVDFPKQNYHLKIAMPMHYIILCIMLNTIVSCLSFGGSFYLKFIFDAIWQYNKELSILKIFVLFLWLFILKIVCSMLSAFFNNKISLDYERNISIEIFENLNNCKQKDIEILNKNEFYQHLMLASPVAKYKANIIVFLVNSISSLVAAFILLFLINYYILIVSIATTALIFSINLISNFFIHKKYPAFIKSQEQWIEVMGAVFSDPTERKNKYLKNKNQKLFFNSIKNIKDSAKYINSWKESKSRIIDLIFNFSQMLIILIGVMFFIREKMPFGNILLLSSISIFLNNPLVNISSLISEMNINKTNITMIKFLLKLPKEVQGKMIIRNNLDCIVFENVNFKYANKFIVKNFSWIIKQNTIIKGNNGSGKSTILKLLYGLYKPQNGKISFNNINLEELNFDNLRSNIYFNFKNEINHGGKVIDLICLNNDDFLKTFKVNYEKYELWKVFQIANLNPYQSINLNADNLSLGQKHLISIFRLFITEYKLILLDEAFENISSDIFELLKDKIIDFQNKAIFVEISHSNKYINNNAKVMTVF